MNTKRLYIFLLTLVSCATTYSMEINPPKKRLLPEEIVLPVEEIWLNVIAQCEAKNRLRQTCTYFHDFASTKNEFIFLQNPLVIKPELLERYALYYADLDNNPVICNLLDQGLNPNTINRHPAEMSLLHYAVRNKNLALVDTLLKHPLLIMDMNAKNNPFSIALDHNYSAIAQRILNAENIDINKAFDVYCRYASDQNIDILTHLLSMNSDHQLLAKLLSYAACHNYIKMADLLLKRNTIDINSGHNSYDNLTPLEIAVDNGHTGILKLLIDHGADINGCRKDYPPLKIAMYHGHLNCMQLLINSGAFLAVQPTLLQLAIEIREELTRKNIIELLLNNEVDVNEKILINDQLVQCHANEYGDSPLSIATRFGKIDVIEILLTHPKINVNIKTDNGKTPLDIAIENPHHRDSIQNQRVKDLLIAHGGKTSAQRAHVTENK